MKQTMNQIDKPTLTIKVAHPFVALMLRDPAGKMIEEVSWEDKNNLSQTLLDSIDKLLAKHKIGIEKLAKINVEAEQERYTSARISKAVAQTVNYCLGVDKK